MADDGPARKASRAPAAMHAAARPPLADRVVPLSPSSSPRRGDRARRNCSLHLRADRDSALDIVRPLVPLFADGVTKMRDGIYKGLTLPRRWRTLLRRCEREADRGSRAGTAALAAVEGDLRSHVSPATVRTLLSLATSAAVPLPGFSTWGSDLRNMAGQTPLADLLLRHFYRTLSTGARGPQVVHDSICDALREWGTRHLHHVEEHYIAHAGNHARDVLDAVRRAINAIDHDEVAARLMRTEKPPHPEKHPIDPDEDLLITQTNAAQDASP